MVRRIASQVHKQASRLTRAGLIKTQPAWFQAVLEHPPLPLPPREPPARTTHDTAPPKHSFAAKRTPGPRVQPITYLEDDIRRQFFRDHPFEAFRPRSLNETGAIKEEHPINGVRWTRLSQRGSNPTPEDAVLFTLNLHQHHNLPLSDAYAMSIMEFRSLRAIQHIATRFAAQEATAYGARFGPSETEQGFAAEKRVLEANELKSERMDDSANLARRRWRMVALGSQSADAKGSEWSRGEEYVRLWQEGVRPDYSPALTEPVSKLVSKLETATSVDFMGTRSRTSGP
ncbi:mitochondrial ribosomal protein S25-domain-containing protein [Gloeopeniophorella convolvens]|nr:mitochondrial ribosomal protein S25-domain-containing protein [Gloeopeniophorella convolvens]